MRLLAIGDVHGQSGQLSNLLDQICFQDEDRLVFLGDYIDRGFDANGTIAILLELRAAKPDTVFLRGNHEQMLLDALFELQLLAGWRPLSDYPGTPEWPVGKAADLYELNGGDATLSSYSGEVHTDDRSGRVARYRKIPNSHIDFFSDTDFYFRHENFLFVHAGINPEDPLGIDCGPFDLLWRRGSVPCLLDGRQMTVVHGHTPCAQPLFSRFEINLDTGAGHGRSLTCCDVLTGEYWQA